MEEKYNHYKRLHPEWSHEQIMAAVSIEMSAANKVTEAGEKADPNDQELVRSVLLGAKEWLHEVLPEVFANVANFFDDIINNIGKWIEKGLSYVFDKCMFMWS